MTAKISTKSRQGHSAPLAYFVQANFRALHCGAFGSISNRPTWRTDGKLTAEEKLVVKNDLAHLGFKKFAVGSVPMLAESAQICIEA